MNDPRGNSTRDMAQVNLTNLRALVERYMPYLAHVGDPENTNNHWTDRYCTLEPPDRWDAEQVWKRSELKELDDAEYVWRTTYSIGWQTERVGSGLYYEATLAELLHELDVIGLFHLRVPHPPVRELIPYHAMLLDENAQAKWRGDIARMSFADAQHTVAMAAYLLRRDWHATDYLAPLLMGGILMAVLRRLQVFAGS